MESSDAGATASSRSPPSGRVSKGLSGFALAVSVVALILTAVWRPVGPVGPKGDVGATGPPGPRANDTILAFGTDAGPRNMPYAPSCEAFANVTIPAPGPGTVVVSASVRFEVTHTVGTEDRVAISLSIAPGRCVTDSSTAWYSPGPSSPSGVFNGTLFAQKPLAILAAANYTYYVNGNEFPGESPALFLAASVVAVYYPS